MTDHDLLRDAAPEFENALPLLRQLRAMGYVERIRGLGIGDVAGRHILDVGCGSGFYGPVLLAMGAASYTGCDYKFSPGANRARDFNTLKMETMDWTGRDLMGLFPGRLDLRAGGWESLPGDRTYDLITMFMVTEHVMDLDGAFSAVGRWLSPEGKFLYQHHNYAAWNGHHQQPRTIHEIRSDDPDQARYIDWNHLMTPPGPEDYTARKLNRIRLDALRALTEKYFIIDEWEELPMNVDQGRDRLTPAIRKALPDYPERELLCQAVRCSCLARKCR